MLVRVLRTLPIYFSPMVAGTGWTNPHIAQRAPWELPPVDSNGVTRIAQTSTMRPPPSTSFYLPAR